MDMVELYVTHRLDDLQSRMIFQQDGEPIYWGIIVREFLDDTFPNK